MYYIPSASPVYVRDDGGFRTDSAVYPAGWLTQASPADLACVGAQKVVETNARPNDRYYVVREVFDGPTLTYDATPMDLDDLKGREVRSVKATAGSLLSETDWKVVRAAEGAKPLDDATATYRAAVREASNAAEVAILACTTVEELAALPAPAWPEAV